MSIDLAHSFQGYSESSRNPQVPPTSPETIAFLFKHENTQPHLALPADAFDYWTCELNPDTVYSRLTPEHLVWCPEKGNNTCM